MKERLRRTVGAAGLVGFGIAFGMLAVRPGPVAADDAGIAAQLAVLAQRVDALEAEKDKPKALKAPFSVVDGAGKEILHVDSQGGRGILALFGSPGSIWMRAGDDLSIEAANSTGSASISIDGEGGVFKVGTTDASVAIGSQGGNPVIRGQLGSEAVIDFTAAGEGPKLTVGQGSNTVVVSATGSKTGVQADAEDATFVMGNYPSLRGFIAAKGQQPLAALGSSGDDKYRVGIYDGGKTLFLGGHNGSHVGLFVSDTAGNEIANIDSAGGSAGGRLKLLGPGGKDIASLGTPEGGGDGGALSLTQGGNKVTLGYGTGAGASLAFTEGGEEAFSVKKDGEGGKLTLGKGDRNIVMKTSGGETVIVAKSGSRRTEMGIGQKSTGFVIGEASKPLAALSDNGDNKPFLGIYAGGPMAKLVAGYQSNGRLGFRLGEMSSPIAALEESPSSAGQLNLYKSGGELAVNAGVGDSGAAGIRLSVGGHQGAVLAAKPDGGGALRIYQGGTTVASVESDAAGAAISVFDNGKERASLITRSSGRGVVVWGSSGAPLIRLVDGGAGGSMVVSDSGGNDLMEARIDPSVGGLFCVDYKGVEKCLGRGLTGMEGFH